MGKECCSNVSSRLWGGALRDETKNGCEGDYFGTPQTREFFYHTARVCFSSQFSYADIRDCQVHEVCNSYSTSPLDHVSLKYADEAFSEEILPQI